MTVHHIALFIFQDVNQKTFVMLQNIILIIGNFYIHHFYNVIINGCY